MYELAWWRDLLVTIWAAIAIVQTCLTALLILVIIYFVLKMKGRVGVLLDAVQGMLGTAREAAGTAQETLVAAKGTTVFLSDNAAKPVIAVASFVAGTRRAVSAFIRLMRKESKSDES